MPIYMDRHDVSDAVTAETVAQLHQQDLSMQDQFGCKGLTYWFDEKRKMAFCLIEAPSKQSIVNMHNQAHGEVPNQIIEVDANVVESFLGRIEDPEKKLDSELNIIDEPAFRAIMMTGFDDGLIMRGRENQEEMLDQAACLETFPELFIRFGGNVAFQGTSNFVVSFESASQAIWCALELYSNSEKWARSAYCEAKHLKTGISAGVPITSGNSFFEEAIIEARHMFYISNAQIVVSPEIRKLYKNENLNAFVDDQLFLTLSSSDRGFLNRLMCYMMETWQNPDLQVEDVGKYLGYSKSQLYRKMVGLTGVSPNNFIKDYRLKESLKLMNREKGTISEIAYESGFNSPSYFAKCFHKKFGFSPSEYFHLMTR